MSFQGDQLQFIPSFVNIELVCCSSKNTGTINNMKVRILTAVLISTYLLVLCAEATIVRKCQGKQVLLNDHSYHKLVLHFCVFIILFVQKKAQNKFDKLKILILILKKKQI